MPQSISNVNIHIVFSTKYRQPLILPEYEKAIFGYLGSTMNNLKCHTICVGGYMDHVHLLCKLYRPLAMSKLVEEVKKNSSKWIKTLDARLADFYWQDGYGVFSVSQSGVTNVIRYIERQKIHHEKKTFQDEFRGILVQHKIEFDEKYVWE
ncbi:MAG: IS200/IS605 family transposase [Saprospiraceae bacterium]|nr:IS200/IS605 family transposase [Saprospiraceae bacterium]